MKLAIVAGCAGLKSYWRSAPAGLSPTLQWAAATEVGVDLAVRQRPAEEKTLHHVTAHFPQKRELFGCFDPFRHHAESEAACHGDDGGDNGGIVLIGLDVADESAIDLEGAYGKTLEIAQRGIAGAEVVDGEPYSDAIERSNVVARRFIAVHQHTLGDLQLQQVRLQPRTFQHPCHLLAEAAVAELSSGQIHRDTHRPIVLPRHCAAAGLLQHPGADRHDQSCFFQQRNEFQRVDRPMSGCCQRIKASKPVTAPLPSSIWGWNTAGIPRARAHAAGWSRDSSVRRPARSYRMNNTASRFRPGPWRGTSQRQHFSADCRRHCRLRDKR